MIPAELLAAVLPAAGVLAFGQFAVGLSPARLLAFGPPPVGPFAVGPLAVGPPLVGPSAAGYLVVWLLETVVHAAVDHSAVADARPEHVAAYWPGAVV